MLNRRRQIFASLMKGNLLKYTGAIGAMVVGVGIGFVSPLLLAGTIDALVNAAPELTSVVDLPEPLGDGSWRAAASPT